VLAPCRLLQKRMATPWATAVKYTNGSWYLVGLIGPHRRQTQLLPGAAERRNSRRIVQVFPGTSGMCILLPERKGFFAPRSCCRSSTPRDRR
jgi:hypothetical protein